MEITIVPELGARKVEFEDGEGRLHGRLRGLVLLKSMPLSHPPTRVWSLSLPSSKLGYLLYVKIRIFCTFDLGYNTIQILGCISTPFHNNNAEQFICFISKTRLVAT